jgi:type IV pilus assembly protein PilO
MDKMKQWALLTVVAILAIAVGGWFVLISPQRSHASDLRSQTQSQQSTNAQLQNEISSLQSQHKGLPQVQAELAKLGVQLPSNPALPALIRSLSSAADAAGVDLISLAPQQPTALATAPAATAAPASPAPAAASSTSTSSTTSAPSAAANVGSLQGISISVIVNGGYFQVEQFVSNLEALTRPFLTSSITMSPQSPTAPTASATSAATAPAATSTAAGGSYDGHVQATISGQVFMVSGTTAAPSTATK